MSVAHLKVISEDIVESDLQGSDACTLDLPLLNLEKIILSVAGNLAQLIQLFIDTARDDISLSELGCCFRMHCPAEIFKEFGTISHSSEQVFKSLDALSTTQLHYRIGLTQSTTELHHLTRHDLAGSST